jgi:hypothetical protein
VELCIIIVPARAFLWCAVDDDRRFEPGGNPMPDRGAMRQRSPRTKAASAAMEATPATAMAARLGPQGFRLESASRLDGRRG